MSQQNPWKTLSSKQIYDNDWITLREDQVLNPAGGKGIYGVVTFKNYAIGIIPIDSELNTYLVGQHRYPLDLYSWEIPMGGGMKDTSMLDSAQRELKEETGIEASEWQNILTIHTSNSVTDETGAVFIARGLTFGEAIPEETEKLQVKKVPLREAFEMVMRSEITDSLSIAGILKAYILISSSLAEDL